MRLIDADAFKDYIRSGLEDVKHLFKDNGKRAEEVVESFCKDIDEQPTIELSQWIPIKWHYITNEEREREGYPKDWVIHIDCEMPCDEQEILVQTKEGYIRWDLCYEDGEFSLDSGWDWVEDIVAWMPLPEPYKERT